MLIGEVARRVGIAASAIRYYERVGLIPSPHRTAKRRVYDPRIIARIRIIQVAREAGFWIAETRTFVSHAGHGPPSSRWRAMADRKVIELDAMIDRATSMKRLLRSSFRCGCSAIEDCENLLLAGSAREPVAQAAPRSVAKRATISRERSI